VSSLLNMALVEVSGQLYSRGMGFNCPLIRRMGAGYLSNIRKCKASQPRQHGQSLYLNVSPHVPRDCVSRISSLRRSSACLTQSKDSEVKLFIHNTNNCTFDK
jgi:hypothetical protein